MTPNLLAAAVLALVGADARAAGGRRLDTGTGSAQFLKLGADARAAALGEAVGAFAQDATALHWNPAGLAALTHRHAALTHAILYAGVFQDHIAYAQPVPALFGENDPSDPRANPYGSVGVSLLYLNAGNMPEVDNTGASTGENFTPRDYAVTAGWGASVTKFWDVGLGVKYVRMRIVEESGTGAADVGTRLRFSLGRIGLVWAASAHNLGGDIKFVDQSDPLPLTFKSGLSARVLRNWWLLGEVVWLKDRQAYGSGGTELRYFWKQAYGLYGRVGYTGRVTNSELAGLAGLGAGGGARLGIVGLDYAWAPFGTLGDSHRLTLNLRF